MATQDDAVQAIIDRVVSGAPTASGDQLKGFAEALAWALVPNQPH